MKCEICGYGEKECPIMLGEKLAGAPANLQKTKKEQSASLGGWN